MKIIDLKALENTLTSEDEIWHGLEDRFQVHITIHDLYQRLHPVIQNPMQPGRHLHLHECCLRERFAISEWDRLCTRDCYQDLEVLAEKHAGPFLKCCWKGVTELVVPVFFHRDHLLTLTAGTFRGTFPSHIRLPAWYLKKHAQLPEVPFDELAVLSELLHAVGVALLHEAEERVALDETGRIGVIRRFLRTQAHRQVSIAELARELFLSPSRAGHLVRELTGKTFTQLLEDERMARADKLLRFSDRTISDIAATVGYINLGYFDRLFQRRFDLSPVQYRQKNRTPIRPVCS